MIDPDLPAVADGADFVRTGSADALTVARFRSELSRWLRDHFALDPGRLNDMLLAANEALTNSAEFAYRGHRGAMTLRSRYDSVRGTLSIDVSDRGTWRYVDSAAQPNTRGRGIPLMRALADRTTISRLRRGTRVRLQFHDCPRVASTPCATTA